MPKHTINYRVTADPILEIILKSATTPIATGSHLPVRIPFKIILSHSRSSSKYSE